KFCEGVNGRRRARRIEDAKRIASDPGIAPCPEHSAIVHRREHAVATQNAALLPIRFETQFLTFTEQTRSRKPTEPLRDARAIDFNGQRFPWPRRQSHTAPPKTVCRHLVAIA